MKTFVVWCRSCSKELEVTDYDSELWVDKDGIVHEKVDSDLVEHFKNQRKD